VVEEVVELLPFLQTSSVGVHYIYQNIISLLVQCWKPREANQDISTLAGMD
jgi:hypothetical protein